MMAPVYSFVDALPPRSPVIDLPSAMVCILFAKSAARNSVNRKRDTYRERRLLDLVGVLVKVHVPVPENYYASHRFNAQWSSPEHHEGRQEKRSRVSQALACRMERASICIPNPQTEYCAPAMSGAEPWTASKMEASCAANQYPKDDKVSEGYIRVQCCRRASGPSHQ